MATNKDIPSTPAVIDKATAADQTTTAPKNEAVKVELTNAAPALSDFSARIENLKASDSVAVHGLIGHLESYITAMAPGQMIDVHDGARQQLRLYRAIVNIAENAPAEEFKKLWTLLLDYFNEYKDGVFGDHYVYRFAEFWTKEPDALRALQNVLNLIKLTANPATRTVGLKQVDLHRSLGTGFTEQSRQRILSFYG